MIEQRENRSHFNEREKPINVKKKREEDSTRLPCKIEIHFFK